MASSKALLLIGLALVAMVLISSKTVSARELEEAVEGNTYDDHHHHHHHHGGHGHGHEYDDGWHGHHGGHGGHGGGHHGHGMEETEATGHN